MGKLILSEEKAKIEAIKDFMLRTNRSYDDITKSMDLSDDLRMWYIARRTSLYKGTLDDDDIIFFRENDFTFGINLLTWMDWCELLCDYLKENRCDTIHEAIRIETKYQLGMWTKRQLKNFTELDVVKKASLIRSGIKLSLLFGHSPLYFTPVVKENDRYLNVWEYFIGVDASLEEILQELASPTSRCVSDIVESYGGVLESKLQSTSWDADNNIEIPAVVHTKNIAIKSLLDNIDREKLAQELYLMQQEEELQERIAAEKQHQKAIAVVTERLELTGNTKEEISSFLTHISDEYLEEIAFGHPFVLKAFNKTSIKRILNDTMYCRWKIEGDPNETEKGFHTTYYAYVLCAFGMDDISLRKIVIDIDTDGFYGISGGCYCEGEQYLHLSESEIRQLFDSVLKNYSDIFALQEKDLLCRRAYRPLVDMLERLKFSPKAVTERKIDKVIRYLSQDYFSWERMDEEGIRYSSSYSKVFIKRIKMINPKDLPEVYMVSILQDYSFEPYLENVLYICYQGIRFSFKQKYGEYSLKAIEDTMV